MALNLLNRITPRATSQTRLLSAAILWTAVGLFLTSKGMLVSRQETLAEIMLTLVLGLMFGLLKSRLVFDRVALKIIRHIESKPRNACLGGLFSLRNWALILVMAVFGKIIGALPMDSALKTTIYVMVGSGLGFSSRLLWKTWRRKESSSLQRL